CIVGHQYLHPVRSEHTHDKEFENNSTRLLAGASNGTVKNIIIVDDDRSLGECLAKLLRSENYETAYFPSALTALEHLKAKPAGLLITDIQMPEMTGLELIIRVREIKPGLPVIAMSGAWDEEMAKELFALDVRWYLPKPLDFGYFAFIVNIALANPNLHGPP
ncbi:MAG: response regulator, partial [Planctomycetota bacterium]